MIVLGIDTTSPFCSVAIVKDGIALVNQIIDNGNTHSEVLLPLIKECLEKTDMKISDIDLFALSSCPGSFTGVRIGTSTVKGLAFASGKPCVGVSTLEALAYNLRLADGIVAPVMDARRNQFYNAVFKCENGIVTRLTEDRLISAFDLEKELSRYEGNIYFVGDGYTLAHRSINCEGICETPKENIPQNGYSVALLAMKIYEENREKEDFSDLVLKPGYLRASQAERERNEKNSKNT